MISSRTTDEQYAQDILTGVRGALVQRAPRTPRLLLYFIALIVVSFIVWSRHAELEEITRGMGKIVPTSRNQVVQNLEGGIVQEILVRVGDVVERDQPLLRLVNKMYESHLGESRLKLEDLRLRQLRLTVEAELGSFTIDPDLASAIPDLVDNERSLLTTNLAFLDNQIDIVRTQIEQRRIEIREAENRAGNLKRSLELIGEQLALTEPLVERGIEAKTDFLRLQREQVSLRESREAALGSIPRIRSGISELEHKIEELRLSFKTRAKRELSEVTAQISQIGEKQTALTDQVVRTLVLSPVRGVVKQLFVHTVHGVVRPGMDLVEIVPLDETLLIEAKILPSDIAFIHPGQTAKVKVTAYDFSIYGGLDGEVLDISADTLAEPNGLTYFLVRIVTRANFLGTPEKPLKIMPGMMVSVDILTGKKSVFDYLVKPIMKAKQQALTER